MKVNLTLGGASMRLSASIAILGMMTLGSTAQAHTHHRPIHRSQRPLVVNVVPPFGDRYAYFSPPGPYQLSAPYHTLCGFALNTLCSRESSYGP